MARLNRIALLVVVTSVLMCILAEELELYPSELDDIDVVKILENDAERKGELNCYLKREPCAEEFNKYTEIFREAVRTNCKRCTEKQKEHLETITNWYKKNQPDNWELILENVNL
ncbi:ejaculatory bulb-specific protein 3 [Solenopsis invicta]|uniref:ejaculatory bulb-specific protein 3 n=1 Tax=Solenopsis invicta TaxID=13686 RepID=UPI00193CCD1B|nr:ejaculatory bulb-specific protein 3 [Solenopsis invicta]